MALETAEIPETEIKGRKMVMKEYTPEDRDRLLSAYDELYSTPEGKKIISLRFGGLIDRETFDKTLDNPAIKYRTIVQSPDGQNLMGWAEYFIDPKDTQRAELSRLIMPTYQGHGIGTALIGHLIEKCRELNPEVHRMISFTLVDNTAAIKSLTKAMKQFDGYSTYNEGTFEHRFTFPLK